MYAQTDPLVGDERDLRVSARIADGSPHDFEVKPKCRAFTSPEGRERQAAQAYSNNIRCYNG